MVRLLLLNPGLANSHPQADVASLTDPAIKGLEFLRKIHQLCLSGTQNTAGLIEHFRDDPHGQHLNKLLQVDHGADDVHPEKQYMDCFRRLLDMQLDSRYQQLRAKEKMTPDEKQEFMLLTQSKSTFSVE